ncbi:MAG: hypothetical protein ACREE5_04550 [Acetobacteraceae bacterium]
MLFGGGPAQTAAPVGKFCGRASALRDHLAGSGTVRNSKPRWATAFCKINSLRCEPGLPAQEQQKNGRSPAPTGKFAMGLRPMAAGGKQANRRGPHDAELRAGRRKI